MVTIAQARHNRAAAIAAGESVYSGAPCRHNHDSPRYVSTRQCVACQRAARVSQTERERLARNADS